MIFKRSFIFSLIVLVMTGLILGWKLSLVDEKDRHQYKKLTSAKENKNLLLYTAKQKRQGCMKQFFTLKSNERLSAIIQSRTAELVYHEDSDRKELVEEMVDVLCLTQEEVYNGLPGGEKAPKGLDEKALMPMQIVKRIQTKKADYSYKNDRIKALNLQLERLRLPGKQLRDPKKDAELLFSGQAENASFSLRKNGHFQAEHFKATLH